MLAGVMQRQDVRVLNVGGDLDLAEKPFRTQDAGEVGVEDLHGDRPVMLRVARQVDGGHAAPAQLTLQDVSPGDRRPTAERKSRLR